ncbi:ABC transporter permease [Corticibacter populi]|uniref:ABC transporter permease n=1 Tax=Corticibacter populi TaxID=1550736 RepID=A0A3M6QKF5_9BURK|nr:ABC transporter permease [Corticibacter populi]RMX03507.1 ABC transporter permease [Corticibacter populi]RZS29952.1 putative spermidine/putrescine transport system permease protein [Corticibacter populi]
MQKNGPLALAFHTLFILFILAPLAVVVAVSFTDKGFISMPTDGLSLRWFRAILDAGEITSAFWFSVRLGLVAACCAVVLAVPAALALARYRFPGREALMAFFMSPLMIPQVVLGAAFLRFFNIAGLSGSFFWLMLTHVVVIVPYAMRLVLSAATGMNREIDNAGLSLGASRWTVFRRITLPMLMAGIAGGWMLSFIQSFDELTMTIFVATPGTMTLPVAMYNHIAHTIDPLVASVSTVLIAGTLVLMLLLDRVVGLEKVLIGRG